MHNLKKDLVTKADTQAVFLRRKADEYVEDVRRTFECAIQFLEFAERLVEYGPGPAFQQYVAICEGGDDRAQKIGELLDEEFRSIHFGCPKDLEQFFQHLVDRATEE